MRTRSNVYTLIKNENTDCHAALVSPAPCRAVYQDEYTFGICAHFAAVDSSAAAAAH